MQIKKKFFFFGPKQKAEILFKNRIYHKLFHSFIAPLILGFKKCQQTPWTENSNCMSSLTMGPLLQAQQYLLQRKGVVCGSRGRQGRLPVFMCTDNLVTKNRPALKGGEESLTGDTTLLKDGFVEEALFPCSLRECRSHWGWGGGVPSGCFSFFMTTNLQLTRLWTFSGKPRIGPKD